jgi:hypothetical protein
VRVLKTPSGSFCVLRIQKTRHQPFVCHVVGPCDFLSPRQYKEACAAEQCGFKGGSNGVSNDVASIVQLNVGQSSSITLTNPYEVAATGRSMDQWKQSWWNHRMFGQRTAINNSTIRIISRNTLVACQR